MKQYDSEFIRKIKLSVLNQEDIPSNLIAKIDSSLYESWNRALHTGIDASLYTLPPESIDFETKVRINDFRYYELRERAELYATKHNFLSSMGLAIFYLDEQKCVFAKKGNLDLLKRLKKMGLKFGVSFAEEKIGTTAVSLLGTKEEVVYVRGEEHYMQALTPYCTAAFDLYNKCRHLTEVLVFDMDKYNENTIYSIEMLHLLEQFHNSSISQELTFTKDKAIDISFPKETHLLIVDKDAFIVDCNSSFNKLFNIIPSQLIGRPVESVFPEMQLYKKEIVSGTVLSNIPISLKGPIPDKFLMNCTPVISNGEYFSMIITITQQRQIHRSKIDFANARYRMHDIVGENRTFQQIKATATVAAQSGCNIMIIGESGTGKELFAQAIHNASPHYDGPFIALNCGAIPENLVESELFGYEKGAFTGANKDGSPGKFELANNGTLFLDEISEMPLNIQVVLLRVLEERYVIRLGGSKIRPINIQLITASNRNLIEHIKQGKFRQDLYYRLNTIKLNLLPLRERKDDIPLLIDHFLQYNNLHKTITISPEAIQLMQQYDWYGNIRELRNAIEYAIAMAQSNRIEIFDLPPDIYNSVKNNNCLSTQDTPLMATPLTVETQQNRILKNVTSYENYRDYERDKLKYLMFKYKGNKSLVAKELGIARTTLYRKLDKLALETK